MVVKVHLTSTILITTKDRKNELRRALESALVQRDLHEILVFDDGSTDGTSEMVCREFPQVRCVREEQSLGIVRARNHAISLASGEIVLIIDDDCVFQSQNTLAQTLKDFEEPYIAAVAIPHINVNSSPRIYSHPPSKNGVFVISEFIGASCAIRRDLFLSLGGFNAALWRQCEEYDFCTRLLDRGYTVRCGTADPVLHFESPKRNRSEILKHSIRGHMLYAWNNVPWPFFSIHLLATTMKTIMATFREGYWSTAIEGFAAGMSAIWGARSSRMAVSRKAYRTIRFLRKHGPVPSDSPRLLIRKARPESAAAAE